MFNIVLIISLFANSLFEKDTTPRFFWKDNKEFVRNIVELQNRKDSVLLKHIEIADSAVLYKFPNSTNPTFVYYVKLDTSYNWRVNPTSDPEFIHAMMRFDWFYSLAIAYKLTQDSKYLMAIDNQLDRFESEISKVPFDTINYKYNAFWHLINVSIRSINLIYADQALKDDDLYCKSIRPLMLSIIANDLSALYKYNIRKEYESLQKKDYYKSNHVILLGSALIYGGLLYEGLNTYKDCFIVGRDILTECSKQQFTEDGIQIESSIHYHIMTTSLLGRVIYLMKINNCLPNYFNIERFKKMIYYIECFLHPDGIAPAISDSDRDNTGLQALYFLPLLFNENTSYEPITDNYLLIPLDLKKYRKKLKKVISFKKGYSFIRDYKNNLHFILDHDFNESGHAHFDLFSFELWSKNHLLIADVGRYIYTDDSLRMVVNSTPVHNTISINNKSHSAVPLSNFDNFVTINYEKNTTDQYSIDLQHNAYGFVEGSPIVFRRINYDYNNSFVFRDSVFANRFVDVSICFNIPYEQINISNDTVFVLEKGKELFNIVFYRNNSSIWRINSTPTVIHPRYLESKRATRICISTHDKNAVINYSINVK